MRHTIKIHTKVRQAIGRQHGFDVGNVIGPVVVGIEHHLLGQAIVELHFVARPGDERRFRRVIKGNRSGADVGCQRRWQRELGGLGVDIAAADIEGETIQRCHHDLELHALDFTFTQIGQQGSARRIVVDIAIAVGRYPGRVVGVGRIAVRRHLYAGQHRLHILVLGDECRDVGAEVDVANCPVGAHADFGVGHRLRCKGLIGNHAAREGRRVDAPCAIAFAGDNISEKVGSDLPVEACRPSGFVGARTVDAGADNLVGVAAFAIGQLGTVGCGGDSHTGAGLDFVLGVAGPEFEFQPCEQAVEVIGDMGEDSLAFFGDEIE